MSTVLAMIVYFVAGIWLGVAALAGIFVTVYLGKSLAKVLREK